MENIFTIGEKVVAVNKTIEPRTPEGHILPDLEQNEEYTINSREYTHGKWWYGVEGIEEAVYTQDEFKLKE